MDKKTEAKLDAVFEEMWREFIANCDELAWDSRLVLEGSTKAAVQAVMRKAWETRTFGFAKDDNDLYVMMDGRPIAKRGKPGTPEAGTWISLEAGVVVGGTVEEITVDIDGVRVLH